MAKYQKLENELQQKLLDAEKEARKQESLLKDVKESLNGKYSLHKFHIYLSCLLHLVAKHFVYYMFMY